MRIAALALVGAVAVSVALAGCTPTAHPTAKPTPKATAVFASDAEALAAAEKAYAAYLVASNKNAKAGWSDSDAYAEYETGRALASDVKSARDYLARGLKQVGDSSFDSMRLEQRTSRSQATVVTYLCLDVTGVDVIDQSGMSIVPSGRISRNPLEVTFNRGPSGDLKVSDSQPWSGSNFC
jgi:hypothetical protein